MINTIAKKVIFLLFLGLNSTITFASLIYQPEKFCQRLYDNKAMQKYASSVVKYMKIDVNEDQTYFYFDSKDQILSKWTQDVLKKKNIDISTFEKEFTKLLNNCLNEKITPILRELVERKQKLNNEDAERILYALFFSYGGKKSSDQIQIDSRYISSELVRFKKINDGVNDVRKIGEDGKITIQKQEYDGFTWADQKLNISASPTFLPAVAIALEGGSEVVDEVGKLYENETIAVAHKAITSALEAKNNNKILVDKIAKGDYSSITSCYDLASIASRSTLAASPSPTNQIVLESGKIVDIGGSGNNQYYIIKDEHGNYAKVIITNATRQFDKNNINLNSNITISGKYFENSSLKFTNGSAKTIAVINSTCVSTFTHYFSAAKKNNFN